MSGLLCHVSSHQILCRAWEKSSKKVGAIRSKHYAKRLISRDDDARVVASEVANINASIQNFLVSELKILYCTINS